MTTESTSVHPKLSALYYPYSRCVNLTALKVYSLLFEEIAFMDPFETEFREFLLFSDKGCQFVPDGVRKEWRQTQESWDFLMDAGFVRIIDPIPIIREHDKLLSASYASDIADSKFVETARDEGKIRGPWKVLASRIPPTVNQSFDDWGSLKSRIPTEQGENHLHSDYQIGVWAWEYYDHYGLREYLIERLGGREAKGFHGPGDKLRKEVNTSPVSPYEQIFLSGGGTCQEDGHPFGMHPYSYADTVSYKTGEKIRILSFYQGASLSISQSLLIAELNGLVPVTDNAFHQHLLTLKYHRALKNRTTSDISGLPQRSIDVLQAYSVLARNVLLETLPPSTLEKLSIEEICKYRDENRDSLSRFWLRIRDISHDLSSLRPEADFNAQLVKILDQAVLPEIQNLQDALENSRRKMFGSLLTKLVTGIPASTAVTVFAGLSPAQILTFGASTALAAFGLSLPAMVAYWEEKAKLRQHWLAFAFNLVKKKSAN